MTEGKDIDDKQPMTRRTFLRKMGIGLGAAALATAASCSPRSEAKTSGESGKPYHPISESKESVPQKESYWEGQVNEGEGLIQTALRIGGVNSMESFDPKIRMICEHNGTTIFFEDRNSISWHGIASLPAVWPGDNVYIGSPENEKMKVKTTESEKMPVDQVISLSSKMTNGGATRILNISGGSFNRPVSFTETSNEGIWKINLGGDKWVEADKLKGIMDANPELRSSEAVGQLQ